MTESKEINNKEAEAPNDLKKTEARDNLFIAVTAALAGVFFVFIIYQIVTSPEQILPLLSCGVAFIVDIFLMIFSIQRKFEVQRQIEKQHFDEMFAAQKASYFVLRRNFDELQERLSSLEMEGNSIPGDDIISAQKALTKVTINRNSENTKAVVEAQRKLLNENRDEMIQSNQELKYLISDMSTEIKSLKADMKALETRQQTISDYKMSDEINEQTSSIQTDTIPEQIEEPDSVIKESAISSQQDSKQTEEPIVNTESFEPEQNENIDISTEETSVVAEPASASESASEQIPAPEPETEPAQESVPEPAPASEPTLAPEPAVSDDPNRTLSPEEIAKLFASMT